MQDSLNCGLVRELRDVIRNEIAAPLDDLRRFIDRRITELSAEIHATVQLVDFSETNLSGQLARIHDQITNMVATPAEASRNSGIELEAVVEATESAANRIMEAAETIGEWVRAGKSDPETMAAVSERLNTIFEACTFQDVTGQRVRRAIQHLRQVETMLTDLMPPAEGSHRGGAADGTTADLAQDDVDQIFA